MRTYFLRTARIGFSVWTEKDLPLAERLWGDARVTRYITASGRLMQAEIQARLAEEIRRGQAHGMQYWPIFALADGSFLGCCGLRPYDTAAGVLEIGFHLCAEQWGKGYGAEAARAAMDYAFNALGAAALFAGHHPDNAASAVMLGKLGFAYTHDEHYPPTGRMHPSYLCRAEDFVANETDPRME